jgi:hypothetical protein
MRRFALFATYSTWPHYQYGFKASMSGATCLPRQYNYRPPCVARHSSGTLSKLVRACWPLLTTQLICGVSPMIAPPCSYSMWNGGTSARVVRSNVVNNPTPVASPSPVGLIAAPLRHGPRMGSPPCISKMTCIGVGHKTAPLSTRPASRQ